MKFKYYLRGFGTGVLFATILLIIAFGIHNNIQSDNSKKDTTENNIVLNRENDGTSETVSASGEDADEGEGNSDNTEEMSTDGTDTMNQSEVETEDNTEGATATDHERDSESEALSVQETLTQEETTEALTTTSSAGNEQASVEPSTVGGQNVTSVVVTIERGMNSGDAARLLAQFGLVDDSVQFDEFMETSGYESRLKIGTYEITRGASYEEIARIITQS